MKFTPRQLADLRDHLGNLGEEFIPGSAIVKNSLNGDRLVDGSVTEAELDPTSVSHWNTAYNLRVETWDPPLSFSGNVASLIGIDTTLDVLKVDGSPETVTVKVEKGVMTQVVSPP